MAGSRWTRVSRWVPTRKKRGRAAAGCARADPDAQIRADRIPGVPDGGHPARESRLNRMTLHAQKTRWSHIIVPLLAVVCSTTADADEPARLKLHAAANWSSVFSCSEIKLPFTLGGPAGAEVNAAWRLAIADRTIERGQVAVTVPKSG